MTPLICPESYLQAFAKNPNMVLDLYAYYFGGQNCESYILSFEKETARMIEAGCESFVSKLTIAGTLYFENVPVEENSYHYLKGGWKIQGLIMSAQVKSEVSVAWLSSVSPQVASLASVEFQETVEEIYGSGGGWVDYNYKQVTGYEPASSYMTWAVGSAFYSPPSFFSPPESLSEVKLEDHSGRDYYGSSSSSSSSSSSTGGQSSSGADGSGDGGSTAYGSGYSSEGTTEEAWVTASRENAIGKVVSGGASGSDDFLTSYIVDDFPSFPPSTLLSLPTKYGYLLSNYMSHVSYVQQCCMNVKIRSGDVSHGPFCRDNEALCPCRDLVASGEPSANFVFPVHEL
jgi:hypothetical protein